MNDPHVVSLHYKLVFGEGMEYRPPATSREYALPDFTVSLDGDHVTFLPQVDFRSREDALAACDPLARAWQLLIAVELGYVEVHLQYERTEVVDRSPTPGMVEVQLEGVQCRATAGTLRAVSLLQRHVDAPDPTVRVNPDVESLWQRYCAYTRGTEPLLSMAYFVLSVVEALAGGGRHEKRDLAAQRFNVERSVLKHIGVLTSERGDWTSARKLEANSTKSPVTSAEKIWLEVAIRKLILQVGRSHSGPSVAPLMMTDLPSLP